MKQRTEDERVAELQAKIEAIRQRGQRKRARANPAVKHATVALKAIDKAAKETNDTAARKSLADAREPLSAWLALEGLVAASVAEEPAKATKRKRNNTAMSVAS